MLEVFKIVVLCLICTVFTALFSTILLTTVLFIIITAIFYDFDFEIPFERHAINKFKHAYLKVRNIYQIIHPTINQSNHYIYSPNMSNVNKTVMDFDLSRFNRSGSVFSPISRIGGTTNPRRLPTQTSTPLTRNSPWQKNTASPLKAMTFQSSTITRSPRYSLSSNEILNEVKSNNQSPTVQTVAGPLLASTRFNINLGTYTDTKSPGLVNRVVQYHSESQSNEAQTHQAKYKSPGQFPIVQLYKKKPPLLTRTPKRCTVRVAPPDCLTYNSPEGNRILRDSFVQRVENNVQNETEINTKSVLDALKEISRKRIHANDDLDDISKRQRKDSINGSDNTNKDGKRLREDTPPKPKGTAVSPSTNKPKKICVTDEIECSLSSSILMRLQGQKRKAGLAVETITNTVKQRKISNDGHHISRQTQTNTQTNNSKSVTHSTQTNITEILQSEKQPFQNKSTTPAKSTEEKEYTGLQQILQNAKRKKKLYFEKSIDEIDEERSSVQFNETQPYKPLFSHEPMEIIMKNRLEVAMAALNGDKPEIIPLPKLTLTEMLEKNKELVQKESGNTLKDSKALTSILSPKNKTKHDKHVSFDIPDITKSTEPDITIEKSDNNVITATTPPNSPTEIKKSPFGGAQVSFGAVTNTTASNNTTPTPLVKDTPQPSAQFKFGDNISFGAEIPKDKSPFGVSTAPTTPNLMTNTSIPSINFGSPNISFGVSTNINTTPSLSFGNSTSNTFTSPPIAQAPKVSNVAPNVSVVPFGSTSTTLNLSTPISTNTSSFSTLPSLTTQSSISFGASQPISFGVSSAPTTSAPVFSPPNQTVNTFGVTTTSTATPIFSPPSQSGAFGGTPKSTFSFGTKPQTETSAPAFNFGAAKSPPKTGGFKFDLGKPVSTTIEPPKSTPFSDNSANKPATFSFGGTSTNQPLPPVFGGNTTSTPTFGATPITTTATPTFGTVTTTQNSLFSGNVESKQAPVFGGNMESKQAAVFGSNTESKQVPVFGAPTNNPTTTASVFGLPAPTNTTTSSVFGSTTSAPAFGVPKPIENKSGFAFGAPVTQSSSFGGFSTPTTTQSSGFAFGGTQPKPNTSTVAPANTNTFAFGGSAPNNKPFTFNSASTTASNVFGGTSAPPAFGAPTSNSGVFGALPSTTPATTTQTSNVFGTPANTTTANTFGQPNSGVFGSTSSNFGGSSTNGSVFGNQNTQGNNTFGAPNQAPFASGSTNVFGGNAGAPSNVFGSPSNTNKSGFGTTSAPAFGGSFGSSSTATPTFGTTPAPTNNNVFGTTANQPNSTFGGTNNNNQASSGGFGNFGAAAQPAAPQGSVFAFGGNAPSASAGPANAFQFGGTTTPAKPAGFNFSANTTTPNLNFTAGNPAPNFSATPAPNFGAPTTGMFSIGSGSTAAKQRPIIKARRRNN